MKATARICILIAAALLAAGNLSAQTVKWAYTNFHYQILARAGDGNGAFVVVEFPVRDITWARCLWVGPEGGLILNHEVELNGENGQTDIVRLNPNELAIRIAPKVPLGDPPINLLRRFQKNGHKIVIIDKILEQDEVMPRVPDNLTDPFGFFIFSNNVVRRYSN